MTDRTSLRTRPDGSIDTAAYLRRGRRARSAACHRLLAAAVRPGPARLACGIAVALALIVLPLRP